MVKVSIVKVSVVRVRGFGGRPCLIGGDYETGFSSFRGVLGATVVKPGFGELDLSTRGGCINGFLTLPSAGSRPGVSVSDSYIRIPTWRSRVFLTESHL